MLTYLTKMQLYIVYTLYYVHKWTKVNKCRQFVNPVLFQTVEYNFPTSPVQTLRWPSDKNNPLSESILL